MQTTHMATPVLEVAHLEKVYGALGNVTRALNDVSFTVNRGEFVGIMGASGSGKSTLLNCVSTIDSATSGTIRINGQDVTRMKQAKLSQFRREELGFIFQDSNLLDTLTARENIALPLTIARTNSAEISTRVQDVAARLSISQVLDKYPYQMSGGQQQRVAIARSLVNEPEILLLDEPLGALDLKLRKEMQLELKRLQREMNITFIYVTHDQEEALTMSDTIVVMNQGYIQQIGTPVDIYNEPTNAFVADFIGESNIIDGVMIRDRLVRILGAEFVCVDEGFGENMPVDVVIRPEDVVLTPPSQGELKGVVTDIIFKGVHYEMHVMVNGYEWLVHSTVSTPIGAEVGLSVEPSNIQIMNKPESEDEEVFNADA